MPSIEDVLRSATDRGLVPGLVAAVGTSNGFRGLWNYGTSDADRAVPMKVDAIFRVASMAKLVTAVAVMTLVDKGQLDLDTDVASILPEYEELMVIEGFDAAGPRLRKPNRTATIRELMTHTAGLAYNTFDADIDRYERLTGAPNIGTGRRDALKLPLVADPGQRVDYGTGFDWAGLVVEKITGVTLDVYCEQKIFEPLGMRMTSMHRPEERGLLCTPVLAVSDGGGFTATAMDFPKAPEFFFGGGCLYSTAEDFLKLQMELAAPGSGRVPILTPASADEIFSSQTGALDIPVMMSSRPSESHDVYLGPGWKWGLGVALNPSDLPHGRPAASGGWAGIFNTFFWVDRTSGIAAGLFMQFLPFFDSGAIGLLHDFETAVYESFGSSGQDPGLG